MTSLAYILLCLNLSNFGFKVSETYPSLYPHVCPSASRWYCMYLHFVPGREERKRKGLDSKCKWRGGQGGRMRTWTKIGDNNNHEREGGIRHLAAAAWWKVHSKRSSEASTKYVCNVYRVFWNPHPLFAISRNLPHYVQFITYCKLPPSAWTYLMEARYF